MNLLKRAWATGLEAFLYDGKLQARRRNGPLTDGDKKYLTHNKEELIFEIETLLDGQPVSFDRFLEDRPAGGAA